MGHVVLLGDSSLDNAAYVRGGPAVIDQVRARLGDRWRATLGAVDGSSIEGVHRQLGRLPEGASHLILSAGGNDVLGEVGVLGKPVGTVGEEVGLLADIRDRFGADYGRLLRAIGALGVPAAVCTIYEPRFRDAGLRREATAALGLFNDVILRAARGAGLPVVDLRALCTSEADYATPVEPSSAGGARIAGAICDVLLRHDFSRRQLVVYP